MSNTKFVNFAIVLFSASSFNSVFDLTTSANRKIPICAIIGFNDFVP